MPHEEPLPPRTDLWVAATFLVFGLVVLALAMQMPTYREQRGEIYTAPGLVPALYGIVVALLSLWLGFRSIQRGALTAAAPPSRREGHSNARLALAAGLGLVFTGGLIGRMPFWIATAVFVTAFIAIFEWQRGLDLRVRLRRLMLAAVQGVVTGAIVMLVFQRIFLVRLP
jgi:hypothetical protein